MIVEGEGIGEGRRMEKRGGGWDSGLEKYKIKVAATSSKVLQLSTKCRIKKKQRKRNKNFLCSFYVGFFFQNITLMHYRKS